MDKFYGWCSLLERGYTRIGCHYNGEQAYKARRQRWQEGARELEGLSSSD